MLITFDILTDGIIYPGQIYETLKISCTYDSIPGIYFINFKKTEQYVINSDEEAEYADFSVLGIRVVNTLD